VHEAAGEFSSVMVRRWRRRVRWHASALKVSRIIELWDRVGREAESRVVGHHSRGTRGESPHSRASGVGRQERSPGHEPHLVHSLLLGSLVLEPDLDDSHGESGLLGQLFPHQPGWLGRVGEDVLEDFQLLGLDGRPRSSPLVLLVSPFGIRQVGVVVATVTGGRCLGASRRPLLAVLRQAEVALDSRVQLVRVEVVTAAAAKFRVGQGGFHLAHEAVVLAVQESVVGRDLDVLADGDAVAADGAEDALGMVEDVVAEPGRLVVELKGLLASRATRPKQTVEISLAVKHSIVGGVTFGLEVVAAFHAPQAAFVQRSKAAAAAAAAGAAAAVALHVE